MANAGLRGCLLMGAALQLGACGGGTGDDAVVEAAEVVISGPMQVLRGRRIEWTVHMPAQPADDPPTGYAITLPEATSRIRIDTTPCAPPATTGCQRWTIEAARDAVPGDHRFYVRPIGMRARPRGMDMQAPLVVLAPAEHHGRAERVVGDDRTVIVAARARDGGARLVGSGDNAFGQLASGYAAPPAIGSLDQIILPRKVAEYAVIDAAAAPGLPDQMVMGGSAVLVRRGGQVLAWGNASGGRLGFAGDTGDAQLVPRRLPEFDGAVALAEGSVRAFVSGTDGQVRVRVFGREGYVMPGITTPTDGGRTVPLTDVVQAVETFGKLVMLQSTGAVHSLNINEAALAGDSESTPAEVAAKAERVPGLPGDIVALAAGNDRLVARDALGRLWAWQQGATAETTTAPAPVTGIDGVVSHSVGYDGRGYAVRGDGSTWSWPPGGAAVRVGTLSRARSVSGSGWVITGHCSEGDGGLWRIDVTAEPQVQRQAGFGDDCAGTPDPTTDLIVRVSGRGSVTSTPAGLACGLGAESCGASFPAGSTVELQAFGAEGRLVRAWGGDCVPSPPFLVRATVVMPAADAARRAVCDVSFADDPPPRLRVSISGPGSVRLETPGKSTVCLRGSVGAIDECERGTSPVTLTALPATGAVFTGWSGACTGTAVTLVQTVVGGQSCTANFAEAPRATLVVRVEGGGTVTSVPAGIACGSACTITLPVDTRVTLTAAPAAGQRFTGWAGSCSGSASATDVLLSAARACTARFEADVAPPPPPPPSPLPAGNLVLNPGFEGAVGLGGLPATPGAWIGDATRASAGEGGVLPRSGALMLKFVATGLEASATLVSSQLWQVVDLSAWSAEIARGDVQADASAWFHRVAGGAGTDRRFDLRLLAFDGPIAEVPARYTANRALAVAAAVVDTTALAWQQAALSLLLPPGTRHVLVEIYAYEDVRNDAVAPEFDGHYADDVALVLRRP